MTRAKRAQWPTAIITSDEDDEAANVVVTAVSMQELATRLEALGPRVAASTNALQFEDRPLLALEVSAGASLPDLFRGIDGTDLTFYQRGLTWRPEGGRLDEATDVYVLTQTLKSPRWIGAAPYAIPALTAHQRVYFVVLLPNEVRPDDDVQMLVSPFDVSLTIDAEVITFPPHPLLWWGTPPRTTSVN